MVDVERMGPTEWERVRQVRLAALADAPEAFGTLLADELERSPESWRARLEAEDTATFLAREGDKDVGIVTGAPFSDHPSCAGLFAMWVEPAARGRGVGDRLVDAVGGWARVRGYQQLILHVADENQPAIALYNRHGFEPTGRRGSLPAPREHVLEHELVLRL